jgi:hypothetical protein
MFVPSFFAPGFCLAEEPLRKDIQTGIRPLPFRREPLAIAIKTR